MARELPIFPALFALFTAVSVFLLLLGLGPPLGQLLPELRESFEAWGRGTGRSPRYGAGWLRRGTSRLAPAGWPSTTP